eukprot:766543-Hanusia_phi.AAC.3
MEKKIVMRSDKTDFFSFCSGVIVDTQVRGALIRWHRMIAIALQIGVWEPMSSLRCLRPSWHVRGLTIHRLRLEELQNYCQTNKLEVDSVKTNQNAAYR